MSEETITSAVAIADLADELGTYRQSIFKVAKRLRIQPVKRREESRRNQQIAFVTQTEAAAIRAEFATRRRTGDSTGEIPFTVEEGMFYVIQLEPEHDPGRLKLGFTTDLVGRLRHHRCSAPFAAYIKSWPCRRVWERAAIDCLTDSLEQLHTEVFRASSLEKVLERGDSFFAVMPKVNLSSEVKN